nr:MAG TPA: hypothetical protein [Caudoviricetes sp.]
MITGYTDHNRLIVLLPIIYMWLFRVCYFPTATL